MRLALLLLFVARCSAPAEPATHVSATPTRPASAPERPSASARSAPPSSQAPTAASTVPALAPEVAAARAGVTEEDAPTLLALRGTFLCDQRVYPRPPAPHLSAWEWAFPQEPAALADELGKRLPGAQREERVFRYLEGEAVQVAVSVHPLGKSQLGCSKAPPPGTKSLVIASRAGVAR
jgi:hypothetical protein